MRSFASNKTTNQLPELKLEAFDHQAEIQSLNQLKLNLTARVEELKRKMRKSYRYSLSDPELEQLRAELEAETYEQRQSVSSARSHPDYIHLAHKLEKLRNELAIETRTRMELEEKLDSKRRELHYEKREKRMLESSIVDLQRVNQLEFHAGSLTSTVYPAHAERKAPA